MNPYYIAMACGSPIFDHIFCREDIYLTGSRFFRTSTPDSDWDFFLKDTAENRKWLTSLGFKTKNDRPDAVSHYNDADLIEVMHYNRDGVAIDMQLVHDVGRRLRAQQLLKSWGLLHGNKANRSKIWSFALSICK